MIDFIVLLIAIHTILYIVRPDRGPRGTGLYPFRRIAYVCWVLFSILMASLAFANPKDAYVTQGTYCYLPPRPFWYRLALAWVPRYLILGTILGIYIAVFAYIRSTISRYESGSGTSHSLPSGGSPTMSALEGLPRRLSTGHRLPLIRLHKFRIGLGMNQGSDIFATHEKPTIPDERAFRKHSQASDGPSDLRPPVWDRYSFGHLIPIPNVSPEEELEPTRPPGSQYPRRNPTIVEALQERKVSLASPFRLRQGMTPHDAQAQTDAPTPSGVQNPDSSTTSRKNTSCFEEIQDIANKNVHHRHKVIKRQIRILFIYPLVYLLTWIIPFINHCLQYNDYYAEHPSFPLVCTSSTIIALQCAIDCWLFGYREKPWRQFHGGSLSLWQSFLFWQHRNYPDGATVERKNEVGVEPKNWWSQEDIFRDTGIRRGSEDPMIERDERTMAAELRRDLTTSTSGGQAQMTSGGVNLALIHRHSGTSIQQLVVQQDLAESELEV